MKQQSHGDHWATIFEEDKALMKNLKDATQKGSLITGMNTDVHFNEGPTVTTRSASLNYADGPVSIKMIIANNETEQINEVVGTFPVCEPNSTSRPVRLPFRMDKWDNLVEANLQCDPDEGPAYNFYLTSYFEDKYKIPYLHEAEFNLVGLAYNCSFSTEKSFQFEGQKAIDFLAKMGKEPDYDEDGSVKPVMFDLTQLVSFFQESDEFPDFYQFTSPATNIEEVTAFGIEMYRMTILLTRLEEDVMATLYVRKSLLERKPEEGESIRGVMWLQGSFATDIDTELARTDHLNWFAQKGDEYARLIAGFNFKKFYDLAPLTVPFTHIKIRDGYVLDGYYAVNGNQERMKLYICRENSEEVYKPQVIDGKVVPDFQDGMHVDGWNDESLLGSVPPMEDFIDMPFTQEGIWENYLLHFTEYMLPHHKDSTLEFRFPIFNKWDLAVLQRMDLTAYAEDPRIIPEVRFIGTDSAVVSCAYWSDQKGLCVEKVAIIKTSTGIKFGNSQITVLVKK